MEETVATRMQKDGWIRLTPPNGVNENGVWYRSIVPKCEGASRHLEVREVGNRPLPINDVHIAGGTTTTNAEVRRLTDLLDAVSPTVEVGCVPPIGQRRTSTPDRINHVTGEPGNDIKPDRVALIREQFEQYAVEAAKIEEALNQSQKLEVAVKKVLAQKLDDVCWRDVYTELAAMVGVEWKPELLPKFVFLGNCSKFHDSLATGTPYATPPSLPGLHQLVAYSKKYEIEGSAMVKEAERELAELMKPSERTQKSEAPVPTAVASSLVRIERTEDTSTGHFNLAAQESGTIGRVDVGTDLSYAIKVCPRPIEVIAKALVDLNDRNDSAFGGLAGELVRVARNYLKGWEEMDNLDGVLNGTMSDDKKMRKIDAIHEKLHGVQDD